MREGDRGGGVQEAMEVGRVYTREREGERGLTYLLTSSHVFASRAAGRQRESQRERESWHKNRKREGQSSACVSWGEAHS